MHMAIAGAFIGSSGSRVLIALLAAGAAGLFVVAITVLLGRTQARVERQLAGYELPDVGPDEGGAPASGRMSEPETAVVQQAVAFTSRLAERTGLMVRTELMLEQADLPLRAAELLFYAPAFAILVFLLFAALAGAVAGLVGGIFVLRARVPYL